MSQLQYPQPRTISLFRPAAVGTTTVRSSVCAAAAAAAAVWSHWWTLVISIFLVWALRVPCSIGLRGGASAGDGSLLSSKAGAAMKLNWTTAGLTVSMGTKRSSSSCSSLGLWPERRSRSSFGAASVWCPSSAAPPCSGLGGSSSCCCSCAVWAWRQPILRVGQPFFPNYTSYQSPRISPISPTSPAAGRPKFPSFLQEAALFDTL